MRNIESTRNIAAILNLAWTSESMRISGNIHLQNARCGHTARANCNAQTPPHCASKVSSNIGIRLN